MLEFGMTSLAEGGGGILYVEGYAALAAQAAGEEGVGAGVGDCSRGRVGKGRVGYLEM